MNLFFSRGKMTIKILKKFTLFLLFTISILGVINADEAIETNNQSRTINTFSIEEIIVTARKKEISRTNISLSITGVAGPNGGTKQKPVGLVYIGVKNGKKVRINKSSGKEI